MNQATLQQAIEQYKSKGGDFPTSETNAEIVTTLIQARGDASDSAIRDAVEFARAKNLFLVE